MSIDWVYWLLMALSVLVFIITAIALVKWPQSEKKGSKKNPHHIFIQDD